MKRILKEIKDNALSYGSIPFWSWNDRLEEGELRHQIRVMKDLGMNGFFMHARGGLETEYLSDDWFNCINACVDEAKKLGMEAWSYDENGWPSGFAGGELLKDKANFAVAINHKSGPFPALPDEDILSVYKKNPDGSFTLVTEDCGEDEYLILYKTYDESYVDTLDAEITDKFIKATHADYKKRVAAEDFGLGKAMPGFFTDEPQYYRWGNPFSNKLPAEFEKAYGYSIYDKLPAVFFDFDGADKFRYDYYYLIHKLFITNFIKKIYDWCEENGCGLTGHPVEESSLDGQMMCIGGVMPFYEYETIPGIDYLSREIKDDISYKQLDSACAQLGKKKALSEMFGCCGWDASPIELKRIAEAQYAGGINIMCQHLYPYSERGQRKRDYPNHYSEHNPWMPEMKIFDNYFNNLGSALSRGNEYAPILVIHPMHGTYCKYKKHTDSHREINMKFHDIARLLGEHQIPYHFGDEWMMSRMASVDGSKIKVGLCEYEAVIIPFTHSLDATTVALLKEYMANGGKVWLFDRTPEYIDGAPENGGLDFLRANMTFDDILAYRDAVISLDGENVSGIRKMSRITDDGRLVYLTNVSENTYEPVTVSLPEGNWAELDLHTLEVKPISYKNEGGRSVATVSAMYGEAHMLIETEEALPSATAPVNPTEFIPVPDKVRLTSTPINVLTLDTAELSYDGVNYEEPLAIVGIKDNLLRQRYNGVVYIRFSFDLEYKPGTLKAVLEPMYQKVTVNGAEVTPDKNDWWFDKSFASAEIAHLVHEGRNEIVVEVNHWQNDYVYYVLYSDVSESLRNCLVFDTEIESMFLIGDFAVKCDGTFEDGPRNSICFDGKFSLTAQPDTVPANDVVEGGFPFFGGRISTEFTYNYTPGGATVLNLDGRFSVADITVNGQYAGKMFFSHIMDLSDYLFDGKNVIGVTLCNSMRNTHGPHHRHDPEPYGVGPTTFSFEKEWNGRECKSYHDRYAFVKFGLKK